MGTALPAFALGQMVTYMLVIHWVSFVYAMYTNSERYFDATGIGCIAFMAVLSAMKGGTFYPRQVLITVAVLIWAARLGTFLLRRIHRVGKDSRFDEFRGVLVRMFLVYSMSAAWGFLCLLPVFAVNGVRYDAPTSYVDQLGWAVFTFGFAVEWLADHQKSQFNQGGAAKNKWIQHGLWRWSRHPNYFGEIVVWVGIWIMSLPIVSRWGHLVVIGPISVAIFLCFVSGIPLLETKADQRWGDVVAYQQYKRRTSVLVPLPPALVAACSRQSEPATHGNL